MRTDRSPFRVFDSPIMINGRLLTLQCHVASIIDRWIPGMEKIQIGKIRRQTIRIRQPIARIRLSIFSDSARGLDGIFNRRW